ncbi:MAG: hypothetical protein HY553_16820 [Elusimicrobia bacterium]|nr:hypothetical protein [Elusimicrobiota bacterium]
MPKAKRGWCMECSWLSVRVAIEGGSSYWCRVSQSRIDGPVAWREACEHFERPSGSRPR